MQNVVRTGCSRKDVEMIKLRDLIKEFVPGTMLDARKKPGDYWKGAITDT